MSRGGDPTDEGGETLGNPAENKKRRRYPRVGENIQQPVSVFTNTTLEAVPLISANRAFKCADLEKVLNVDRHCVHDARVDRVGRQNGL